MLSSQLKLLGMDKDYFICLYCENTFYIFKLGFVIVDNNNNKNSSLFELFENCWFSEKYYLWERKKGKEYLRSNGNLFKIIGMIKLDHFSQPGRENQAFFVVKPCES